MSPSNRLAVVILIKNTDDSPLSDKRKGAAEVAPDASPILLDDESSAAFASMTSSNAFPSLIPNACEALHLGM